MKFLIILIAAFSILLAVVTNVIYMVIKLLGALFRFKVGYWVFALIASVLVALSGVLLVHGHYVGRFKTETKEIVLDFKNLPEGFDGYRIVQISDIHLDGWTGCEDSLERIVGTINSLDADAIFFTGDLVSVSEEEIIRFMPILKKLEARDGVFSVLGNHDYVPYNHDLDDAERNVRIERLKSMERDDLGWNLLTNSNTLLRHNGDSIAILGSENQSMGLHDVVTCGDLGATMAGTHGLFRILLTHDPTQWRGEVLGKTDIELTLSGHTHGGQVRLLGVRFSSLLHREHAGLYEKNGQVLYVNTGLGATLPSRIGTPAEITVIELHRSPEAECQRKSQR